MATLYFVCGGPFQTEDALKAIFGHYQPVANINDGVFDRCGCDDGIMGCLPVDDHWVFSGDSNVVFQHAEHLATRLSENGRAGIFLGQSTACYYEIITYKRACESSRILDPHSDLGDRPKLARRKLCMDDLWSAADEILPQTTSRIFDRQAKWFTLDRLWE